MSARSQTPAIPAGVDAYGIADAADAVGVGGCIEGLVPQTVTDRFVGFARTGTLRYLPWRDVPLVEYGGWKLHSSAEPGDVTILDGGGLPLTMMGGLAATNLKRRGAVGAVVNGFVRDIEEIEELSFPVFARDVGITTAAGHAYVTDVGKTVSIQGIEIATGDLVAGCRGGLVVVPRSHALAVLQQAVRGSPKTKALSREVRA